MGLLLQRSSICAAVKNTWRYLFYLLTTLAWFSATAQQSNTTTADNGWPRQVTKDGNVLVYYQPQIRSWKDYSEIDADMAFSLTPKNGSQVMGVASFHSNTVVDKDKHLVYLHDLKIVDVRFPSLHDDSVTIMGNLFKKLAPNGNEPVALERLMADMRQEQQTVAGVQLKNDPPTIFYSTTPAIALIVQGDPVLSPIDKTKLEFVVNTNWDLFYDKSGKSYYLLVNSTWLSAKELKGPWQPTKTLPKDMSKLPSGQNFDEVKKAVPPPTSSGAAPNIFFSATPAELILLRGTAVYSKIPSTSLLYIANTDNDVFLDNTTQLFYVLLSGRWFSSASLNGPWTYAGDKLPADFSKIPDDSPKSAVLSSVPGTVQASDAVMLAQIPTTAVVNKAEVEAKVHVVYDGDPKFTAISGTSLQYASNTQDKVIKDAEVYYLCYQGVWFVASNPNGPWKTADSVPKEIYSIPPSSPVYNVTYVTQTNATETTVEASTTAGYFGAFIIGAAVGACLTYGTGWYYPPYIYYPPGMLYPVYRPWPCTYGAGVAYNPWTGGWAAGRRAYGPYAAAGSSAWYNPATGRYGHAASVQTWGGGRTAASTYNPWTGGFAGTSQGHNAYAQWGSSVATRNGQGIQTGHITTANGTTAGYRTSTGQHGVVHTGANGTVVRGNNNVYAGHDGNVYKKGENGNWSQFNNGHWQQQIGGEGGTMKQLNSSSHARVQGQAQAQHVQRFQRPAGGGMRRR
jgi:hypothetical protein